ncbi:MAG: type VI secretion system tip protein VgrG [Bacteroidia bacterium]|nr:type VI secretion system tip protein VgrG [Bacteroidia bacterium]
MPEQVLNEHLDVIQTSITAGGSALPDSYEVLEIETWTEFNRISYMTLKVRDGDPQTATFPISESTHFEPGKEIEVKLGYQTGALRSVFKGIVVSHALRLDPDSYSSLVVTCCSKAIQMTIKRSNQLFSNKKDSDIIQALISDHGLSADVTATTAAHKEVLQYQSTNWDFLLTRAELNGMLVRTDADKVIVKAPQDLASGDPVLKLTYGIDLISADLAVDARAQLESVAYTAWDPANLQVVEGRSSEPSLNRQGNLKGKDLSSTIHGSAAAASLMTSSFLKKEELEKAALGRLTRSRLSLIRGTLKFHGNALPVPGAIIELGGLGPRFNGNAFVSGVRHECGQGTWTTSVTVGIAPELFAEARDVQPPPAQAMIPGIEGTHIAIVSKLDSDPDGEYRIQIKLPTMGDAIVWARIAQMYASNSFGAFFMPEVGDEVLVVFVNQDPRSPVIIGSLYGKKNKPPYTADADNTFKAVVTRSKLKLEFEDKNKLIILETPAGNRITMDDKNKQILIEDQNSNKITLNDAGIKLDSPKDIVLKAQGKISLEATGNVTAKSSGGDFSAEGLNGSLKGSVSAKVEGAQTEVKGTGMLKMQGGMVMIN